MITKKELLTQLEALKIFPKNKLVRELQKQIKLKITKLDTKTRPKKTKFNFKFSQMYCSLLSRPRHIFTTMKGDFPF